MDYEVKARTYKEISSEGKLQEVLDITVCCDNENATIKMGIENKNNKIIQMKDVFIDDER